MGLLDFLKIGNKAVKLKPARQAVLAAQGLLDTEGVAVLENDKLNALRSTMAERTRDLQVAHESDAVKRAAIDKAVEDCKTVENTVQAAKNIKAAHIERFDSDYAKTFDTILKPLREKAAAKTPGAEYFPPVEGQLEENAWKFHVDIRKARTATDARDVYDKAVTEHERLKKIAQAIKPAEAEAAGQQQVEGANLFKVLQQGILAMEMANAPGASDLSKRLYATLAKTREGDHAGALKALQALERGLSQAAGNNRRFAEDALQGPRAEAGAARARMERLAANPVQGKLGLVKAVLPTITAKLATLDMFLDGNLTPKSVTAATAMLAEIGTMLTEAETLTPASDKTNKDTIAKIKETLVPKSFVIFRGKGAEAEALFPKEYAALVSKKDGLSAEVEGLGVAAARKVVQDLVAEAQTLIDDAAARRAQLNQWKLRLVTFETAVKGMNAVVKGDPDLQAAPEFKSKTAAGPFVDKTGQLKRGLEATPPDATMLANLVAELDALLPTFDPAATGYKAAVVDAHKASRTQAADFAQSTAMAEPRCLAADAALKAAKDAVGRADPADGLGLKSAVSEIAASKKQVRAATDAAALTQGLERLENAIKAAERLKQFPGGDAPHSRAKLGDIDKRWTGAVAALRKDLGAVKQEITAADNLPAESKAAIGGMVDTALARFDGAAFTPIIVAMTTKPSNENVAERMKAREQGLRLVRQFRDAISGDPVISSLVISRAFPTDSFTLAHQALNDLDLNLSRAV